MLRHIWHLPSTWGMTLHLCSLRSPDREGVEPALTREINRSTNTYRTSNDFYVLIFLCDITTKVLVKGCIQRGSYGLWHTFLLIALVLCRSSYVVTQNSYTSAYFKSPESSTLVLTYSLVARRHTCDTNVSQVLLSCGVTTKLFVK